MSSSLVKAGGKGPREQMLSRKSTGSSYVWIDVTVFPRFKRLLRCVGIDATVFPKI